MAHEMPKIYDPVAAESRLYEYWLKERVFEAQPNPAKKPFCIVMPPPNVTGVLHMGHALDNSIQDLLTRWRRMQNYEALWLPGTDHAGIATQNVTEKLLAEENITRHDLGRKKFLERVWQVKEEHHRHIVTQLRRFGSSLDWRRERFTMDEQCAKAVREAFVMLYDRGLIYRGDYMVNWCPRCATGISDLEVDHEDHQGSLWHFRYPEKDGGPGLVVATTRPETMLGDTAVAVNPADERYRHLIGKTLMLPLMDREIPVVADEHVDMEFGTGAVKVTPSHDPNDSEIAQRHALPGLVVINKDATMTEEAGRYQGLDRYDCRTQVVADLDELGLLERIEPYTHAVGHCQRCNCVVEPLVSTQWFLKMQPLAEKGLKAVEEGKVRFVPERWRKIYTDWLEKIRDWPISRQLWWGHPIPVWYCNDCEEKICALEEPRCCPQCRSSSLRQDEDVLDTWFSSALWPFSTLGWPEKTPELEYFYPTSVLVTAYDIIFFWVARMIMMAMEINDEEPFSEVFIHGLVRDERGRKISKSLGNNIDPLELIDKYGADALRFALIQLITHGQDITYSEDRMVGARNFCNKLWNAARFVQMNQDALEGPCPIGGYEDCTLSPADRWILSRQSAAIAQTLVSLERYDLARAADSLYDYVWTEFCDWYVELCKPALYGDDLAAKQMKQWLLQQLLSNILRALHPFMPFITEEIWQRVFPGRGSIAVAPYPMAEQVHRNEEIEKQMVMVQEVTNAIRSLRAVLGLAPHDRVEVTLVADEQEQAVLQEVESGLRTLARLSELNYIAADAPRPERALAAVAEGVEVFLHIGENIDAGAELARLNKKLDELEKNLKRSQGKLANASFVENARPAVVELEHQRLAETEEEMKKLQAQAEVFKRFA